MMAVRKSPPRFILGERFAYLGALLATMAAGCGPGSVPVASGPSAGGKTVAAAEVGPAKSAGGTTRRRAGLPSSSRRELQKKHQQATAD